jgi:hypothetical protein
MVRRGLFLAANCNATAAVTPRHPAQLPTMATYVGMGLPPAAGEFTFDAASGQAILNWPPPTDPGLSQFLAASQHTLDVLDQSNTVDGAADDRRARGTQHGKDPGGGCGIRLMDLTSPRQQDGSARQRNRRR